MFLNLPSIKKSDIQNQQGLRNRGNTCYINTAIQTLLAYPDLAEALATIKDGPAQEGVSQEDHLLTLDLRNLLILLLSKQKGEATDEAVVALAWEFFIERFRNKTIDGGRRISFQQEDSSFALGIFFELLKIQAPFSTKTTTIYHAGNNRAEKQEEKTEASHLLLKWESGRGFGALFTEESEDLSEVIHPNVEDEAERKRYVKAKQYTTAKRTTVFTLNHNELPNAFTVLPDHAVSGDYGQYFAPLECHYVIPAEVSVTVQGQIATYVLASFSQKIGGAGGGHYIAYRREGERWYEIDDGRVSPKGPQLFTTPEMPPEAANALNTTAHHCARQLVYVRKDKFMAQYQAAPTVRPAVSSIDPQPQPEPAAAPIGPEAPESALLKKEAQFAKDLTSTLEVSIKESHAEKKDGDIWPKDIQEIIEEGGDILELPKDVSGGAGLDITNRLNWHILVGLLNYYPQITKVNIQYADVYTDTPDTINKLRDFLSKALEKRKGQVAIDIKPIQPPLNSPLSHEAMIYAGRPYRNTKRLVWRAVLAVGVIIGIVVLAVSSMGAGLGILAGVLVGLGLDKLWQHRNLNFKSSTLLAINHLFVDNAVSQYTIPMSDKNQTNPSLAKLGNQKESQAEFHESGLSKYLGRMWYGPESDRAKQHAKKDMGFQVTTPKNKPGNN